MEVDGQDDGFESQIEELSRVQKTLDQINDEASKKIIELEQQFSAQRWPLYQQRGEILSGIPNFWGNVFSNHGGFKLNEVDMDIFEYVSEMCVEHMANIMHGFHIFFTFKTGNPYFTNAKVKRTINYNETGTIQVEVQTLDLTTEGEDVLTVKSQYQQQPQQQQQEPQGDDNGGSGNEQSLFWKWFITPIPGGQQARDVWADMIREEVWTNPMWMFEDRKQAVQKMGGSEGVAVIET